MHANAKAQQTRPVIGRCQLQPLGAQQTILTKPVVQPHPQPRIASNYLHVQRCLQVTRLLNFIKYIESLEVQAMRMPRGRQLVEQIAHVGPAGKTPASILQKLPFIIEGLAHLRQRQHLGSLGFMRLKQANLPGEFFLLKLQPLRQAKQTAEPKQDEARGEWQRAAKKTRALDEGQPCAWLQQIHDQNADKRANNRNSSPPG